MVFLRLLLGDLLTRHCPVLAESCFSVVSGRGLCGNMVLMVCSVTLMSVMLISHPVLYEWLSQMLSFLNSMLYSQNIKIGFQCCTGTVISNVVTGVPRTREC